MTEFVGTLIVKFNLLSQRKFASKNFWKQKDVEI